LGFEGSYDRGAAFARQWKVDQLERVHSSNKSTHRHIIETGNDSYRSRTVQHKPIKKETASRLTAT